MRDARPFLAHHLRVRADERSDTNGADLHLLARWVENLPVGDPSMEAIAATNALGYSDGSFDGGPDLEELVHAYIDSGDAGRAAWVVAAADAVVRHWANCA